MMILQEGFYDGSFFTVVIYKAVGKTAGEVPETAGEMPETAGEVPEKCRRNFWMRTKSRY